MQHLNDAKMSYVEHMRFALGIACALFIAGSCLVVHAFVPCLFEKTASTTIRRLYELITDTHLSQ